MENDFRVSLSVDSRGPTISGMSRGLTTFLSTDEECLDLLNWLRILSNILSVALIVERIFFKNEHCEIGCFFFDIRTKFWTDLPHSYTFSTLTIRAISDGRCV